ncbi:MAG: TIR domain-containing protein [Lachnospiraceae bacterium]|nr:TIR domain-containing protein [Lachnospiraceae bacterium]
MKYDAFISYRHTPLDTETAKKVHTFLETYHVPAAVQKKTGKKKIKRVFRDQEELPIGSDLNDNISEAIKESEYLIVICSPDTPGSYWVNKEIETFIALHDRSHVLAVLTAGEPDESFPTHLLVDDEGKPVEPLAADVRGETQKARNARFKTEMLRLTAPVLGCTYDDLKQRHRERIIKRNIAIASVIASVIAVAGIAFGIYNARVAGKMKKLADEKAVLADEKTVLADEKSRLAEEKGALADQKTKLLEDLTEEYLDKQKNQSRFYAEESLNLLEKGYRRDAAAVAAQALPGDNNERPYVPEAEYALSSALHVYDTGKAIDYDYVLEHDLSVKYQNYNEQGQLLTTIDSGENVYVWNISTYELSAKIPCSVNDSYYLITAIAAAADTENIYVATKQSFRCHHYDGSIKYEYDLPEDITGAEINMSCGKAFLISPSDITIVSLSDGSVLKNIKNTHSYSFSSEYALSDDYKYFAAGHISLKEDEGVVTLINLEDYSVSEIKTSNSHVLEFCFNSGDQLCTVSCNDDFLLKGVEILTLDIFGKDGETKAVQIPAAIEDVSSFDTIVKATSADGAEYIVVAVGREVFSYNIEGLQISHFVLNSTVRTMHVSYDSGIAWFGFANGDILPADFLVQHIYTDSIINTKLNIRDMELIANGATIVPIYSDMVYILKYHVSPDLETLAEQKDYNYLSVASSDGSYFAVSNYSDSKVHYIYDKTGNLVYTFSEDTHSSLGSTFYGRKYICVCPQSLWVIDPDSKECSKTDFGNSGMPYTVQHARFTGDGRYAVVFNSKDLLVYDLETMECLYSETYDKNIICAELSNDAKTLLLSLVDRNLTLIDIASKEKTVLEDDNLKTLTNLSAYDVLAVSKNGKLGAMACIDGNVRVIELDSGEIFQEIPMNSHVRCFIRFTADDDHLILQGDDYAIKVWDIGRELSVSYTSCNTMISTVIEDSDGHLAMCTPYFTGLFETDTFALVAQVQYGFVYIPEDNSFLIQDQNNIYRTVYKDYKTLIKEAERQFGSLELSDEKKIAYNIN